MASYNIGELIATKRNADVLSDDQIKWFIQQVMQKKLHDAQIGAFLMAVFLKGMTREETVALTSAMAHSGETLSWPNKWKDLVVDKHSTGGVGDKVSLVLAPALAACGLKVPMISGRSLAFTGGTLDKLESIPGFNISMDSKRMAEVLDKVGCCIIGQTEQIAPADKVLYALRDITSTVASKPLICSSIISKKAAEGLTCLVLDVKYGRGSFQSDHHQAEALATSLSHISNTMGIKTTAFITHMHYPLGRYIGNSLEIIETIQCLKGNGPEDLIELVTAQGGELLYLKGITKSNDEGRKRIGKVLTDGSALRKFKEMCIAQDVKEGDATTLCENPQKLLSVSSYTTSLPASKNGFITAIDALDCGEVSFHLGAGRTNPTDKVSYNTGLHLNKTVGEEIKQGETWITVYHKEEKLPACHKDKLEACIRISDERDTSMQTRISAIRRYGTDNKVTMVCQ